MTKCHKKESAFAATEEKQGLKLEIWSQDCMTKWHKRSAFAATESKQGLKLESEARIAWQCAIRKKVHVQQQKQNRVWRSNLKLGLHDNVPLERSVYAVLEAKQGLKLEIWSQDCMTVCHKKESEFAATESSVSIIISSRPKLCSISLQCNFRVQFNLGKGSSKLHSTATNTLAGGGIANQTRHAG
jgi:hypothetical protein